MTEIDTSKTSREFDAWIAENVMGCTVLVSEVYHEPVCCCQLDASPHEQANTYVPGILARYTYDIAASWQVVEKLAETHKVRLYAQAQALWHFSVYIHEETYGHLVGSGGDDDISLAICQAAYAALTKS